MSTTSVSGQYYRQEHRTERLLGYIREGVEQAAKTAKVANQKLVLFLGNTGAGKSTLINYLSGCTMERIDPKSIGASALKRIVVVKPISKGGIRNEVMKIGHIPTQSETLLPETTIQDELVLCDCPGLLENRGFEISVANAVTLRTLIEKVDNIKIVLLVNYNSLYGDRSRGFLDTLSFCLNLFGSEDKLFTHAQSILLGVTHIPLHDPQNDQQRTLEDLRQIVRTINLNGDFRADTIQRLTSQLFIYDPTDKPIEFQGSDNRASLIRKVKKLPSIQKAAAITKTVLTTEDRTGLDGICQTLEKEIESFGQRGLLRNEIALNVANRLEDLTKLSVINHQYVNELINQTRAKVVQYFEWVISGIIQQLHQEPERTIEEAKLTLQQLYLVVGLFGHKVRSEVSISQLEQSIQEVENKMNAEHEIIAMQEKQQQFIEFCHQNMFDEAGIVLKILGQLLQSFITRYSNIGLKHEINLDELKNFLKETKAHHLTQLKQEQEQRRLDEQTRKQIQDQEAAAEKAHQKAMEEHAKKAAKLENAKKNAEKPDSSSEDEDSGGHYETVYGLDIYGRPIPMGQVYVKHCCVS